ncbi:MAG: hypothetical protein GQ574_11475 [Crocinitomix sp.]|nr:hypothetical protein [Crocinitomix sp.]
MIRRVLLFQLLILLGTASAQKVPDSALIPITVDSIRLRIELNREKEMLSPGNEEEVHKLLGTTRLDSKTSKQFIKRISKKGSYSYGRALLTHHSLVFTCFSNEKVALTVHISTLTRNISLYKEGTDSFYGKISKKLGNYLVKLLVRLNLYEQLHETGDTEGID